MGKYLGKVDMAAAKKEEEIFNSRLKRGAIEKPETIKKTYHVVCGCGVPGCIFMAHIRSEPLELK
jgi:hypothetical protein